MKQQKYLLKKACLFCRVKASRPKKFFRPAHFVTFPAPDCIYYSEYLKTEAKSICSFLIVKQKCKDPIWMI